MILAGLLVGLDRDDQISGRAACLRIKAFNDPPPYKTIHMKISFPTGTEYESFRVETEIIWKSGHFGESWDEYYYASKFFETLNGYYLKFKRHFCR